MAKVRCEAQSCKHNSEYSNYVKRISGVSGGKSYARSSDEGICTKEEISIIGFDGGDQCSNHSDGD